MNRTTLTVIRYAGLAGQVVAALAIFWSPRQMTDVSAFVRDAAVPLIALVICTVIALLATIALHRKDAHVEEATSRPSEIATEN